MISLLYVIVLIFCRKTRGVIRDIDLACKSLNDTKENMIWNGRIFFFFCMKDDAIFFVIFFGFHSLPLWLLVAAVAIDRDCQWLWLLFPAVV